jgi:toxin YoeB
MKDIYVNESLECYLNWQKTNKKHVKRIIDLIIDISEVPFIRFGKPLPLQHKSKGYWSRSTDNEHRLIYAVKNTGCLTVKFRSHYD